MPCKFHRLDRWLSGSVSILRNIFKLPLSIVPLLLSWVKSMDDNGVEPFWEQNFKPPPCQVPFFISIIYESIKTHYLNKLIYRPFLLLLLYLHHNSVHYGSHSRACSGCFVLLWWCKAPSTSFHWSFAPRFAATTLEQCKAASVVMNLATYLYS